VRYLGQWMPKARAFNVPSEQQWFPEEGVVLGVPTPKGMYQVPASDTSAVLEKLREAREAGEESITYHGQEIPADDETVQAFEQVVPEQAPKKGKEPPEVPPGSDKLAPEAPVIVDNLEELEYSAAPRKTAGAPGGLPAALGSLRLYPHQQKGLEWLQKHWTSGSRGALLADDMGLGKTLQALAFMAWVQEQMEEGYHPRKPLLVVAPTGLLRNWEAEAERHLEGDGLGPVLRAYGSGISTLSASSHRERRRQLAESGWVLTTYETLRDKFHLFLDLEWAVVVFDEVQKIKNPGARATDIAKSVAGDFAVALTGTPVENSLTELWCIVDTISPGYLGALREFREKYERPARENPEVAGQVKELLEAEHPPKLLRRMKEDHLPDLPRHETHLLERNMAPAQSQAYRAALQSAVAGQGQKGSALQALQQMRRVSLLPADLPPEGITDEYVGESARLQAAIEVLDQVHARGEKALVFLEYLDVQAGVPGRAGRAAGLPAASIRHAEPAPADQRAARRQPSAAACRFVPGYAERSVPGHAAVAQGGRCRPHADCRQSRDPPHALVEPGGRGPVHRPSASDRAGARGPHLLSCGRGSGAPGTQLRPQSAPPADPQAEAESRRAGAGEHVRRGQPRAAERVPWAGRAFVKRGRVPMLYGSECARSRGSCRRRLASTGFSAPVL